jgi:competence ComEA-like helix-hairpin-helix protein
MGLDDRGYGRDRRLNFPELHPRRWWHRWRVWLPIAATVIGLASATVWLVRDARVLLPTFGPETGSLVVNINTATEEELQTVPGIGPARAAQIVAGRPWASVDEIVRIQGIGSNQLEGMRPFLTVTGETKKRDR